MNTDDDIAAALPKPPPPAPAPREAAIGMALRRFDGTDEAPVAPLSARAPKRRWWPSLQRPQTGILVSAALVALIGLPVAWVSLEPQSTIEGESRPAAPFRPANIQGTAAASDANTPPPAVAPPAVVPPELRPVPPRLVPVDIAPAPPPPPPAIVAPPPPPPPPMAIVAGRSEAVRDRQADAPAEMAKVANREPAITAQRAPSPAAAPRALAEEDTSSIIVTAAHRPRGRPIGRGDWNACTVNDPKPQTTACKRLHNPAAKGIRGLAAAGIADGLSQAWDGNVAESIAAFDRAIAADPRSAAAHLNRGLAYSKIGELDRAIADLDQAVRYAPRAARGYYNRSVLLRQRGDIRRARADEERAISLDPSYHDVVR